MSARPKFNPSNNFSEEQSPALSDSWQRLLQCEATFPKELFLTALLQLVEHPEYNSTLILRSEQLSDSESEFPFEIPHLKGYTPLRCIHRRLLPRRPGRDAALEQYCTLYAEADHSEDQVSMLVLTPLGSPLPYYHPAVSHIAFRSLEDSLRIEVLPLEGTSTDPNSRLYRTSLALLDTVHRYWWGALTSYKKRVQHDNLVPREVYQDLYLEMREKYKHLVNVWQESTDPLKHVFEDIGIATYLILLWRYTFSGHPPEGFLDFGCGNGLLTHILVSEGFSGYGIDLRARTSWSHYPQDTQDHLKVHAFDPFSPVPDPFLKPGVFLIGNHADELTPWVPLLATLHSASGYLNIPCCPWTLDTKFDRTAKGLYPLPDGVDLQTFTENLSLGGHSSPSSAYSTYRIWLASLTHHCGWKVECEMLRIPSTRNWAIVGRTRLMDVTQAMENAEAVFQTVKDRALYKPRRPEGKAGVSEIY